MTAGAGRAARRLACLAVAAALAAACGASSSSPTAPSSRFDAGERAAGQATTASVQSARTLGAQAVIAAAPSVRAGSLVGRVADPEAPEGTIQGGACTGTVLRYYNAQGIEQPIYSPLTTTRITAQGTCVYSGVATIVNLVFDDMQVSASSMLVNGTTQSQYEGYTVYGTLRDVRIPKQTCSYPTGGEISARVDLATMTIRFDGSATASASYSIAGFTYTFSVPLTSGC